MAYHSLLGDIDYRNHTFLKWEDKVDWEVAAINQAIENIKAEVLRKRGIQQ